MGSSVSLPGDAPLPLKRPATVQNVPHNSEYMIEENKELPLVTDWRNLYLESVSMVINCTAPPSELCFASRTPLHFSVPECTQSIIDRLVSMLADPSIRQLDGNIAVLLPIVNCNDDLVQHSDNISLQRNKDDLSLHKPVSPYSRNDTSLLALLQRAHVIMNELKLGHSPLHSASTYRMLWAVKSLLDSGRYDPNAVGHNGSTALHLACSQNYISIVNQLVSHKVDPDIVDKSGNSPMHIAVQGGFVGIVECLLKHVKHLDGLNRDGQSPLHLACHNKDVMIGKLLLARPRRPNRPDVNGVTPLHLASQNCLPEIVYALLKLGAEPDVINTVGQTPLLLACTNGHAEIVQLLLKSNANPNLADMSGNTPLHAASRNQHNGILKPLLDSGARPDLDVSKGLKIDDYNIIAELVRREEKGKKVARRSSLSIKSQHSEPSLANVQLAKYTNPKVVDSQQNTLLHIASVQGNDFIVRRMMHRVRLNNSQFRNMRNMFGQTALYLACRDDHPNVVEALLLYKVDVDLADNNGVSPLSIASWNGHLAPVKLLVSHGCNVNLVDKELQTALHKACGMGYHRIAERLLQRGADARLKDCYDSTPLHIACLKGHLRVVSALLRYYTIYTVHCWLDINVRGSWDQTPLHDAVQSGNVSLVQFLLDKGASINAVDIKHENALFTRVRSDTAIASITDESNPSKSSEADTEILQLLVAKGCKVNETNMLGRTLLHVAVECRTSMRVLDLLAANVSSINVLDNNLQSAVHVAALNGNFSALESLVAKGAVLEKRDKFGALPLHLSTKYPYIFAYLFQKLPKDKSISLTKRDLFEIAKLAYWHNTLIETLNILSSETTLGLPPVEELVPRFWHQPQENYHDFEDITTIHGTGLWISRFEKQRPDILTYYFTLMQTQSAGFAIDKLAANVLGMQLQILRTIMESFIKDVASRVAEICPLLAFTPVLAGSVSEGTKVLEPNEMDFLCVLHCLTQTSFRMPSQPSHNSACVKLQCKQPYAAKVLPILTDKSFLDVKRLFHLFHKTVVLALSQPDLWKKYPGLFCNLPADLTTNKRSISYLELWWRSEYYCWLRITVDLVPAFAFPDWKPAWCLPSSLVQDYGCYAVAKWIPDAASHLPLFQLGFSKSETELFRDLMPPEMVDGYKLAKIMRDKQVCPRIGGVDVKWFITTYMLKNCIVTEFMDLKEKKQDKIPKTGNGSACHDNRPSKKFDFGTYAHPAFSLIDQSPTLSSQPPGYIAKVIYWTRRIFERLEKAFQQQHLQSAFVERYNLLSDSKYLRNKHNAVAYANLLKRMVTVHNPKGQDVCEPTG